VQGAQCNCRRKFPTGPGLHLGSLHRVNVWLLRWVLTLQSHISVEWLE